ncbi:MAG: methyltransferase domain-containing protein [Gammaproteobacteria bacterium]|nr:methyltransferase domain-containing protein [Gammaproteobacteria bacterium]
MLPKIDNVRRLHIGGRQPREGWEIFDAIAADHVDHLGNARNLKRFPDGTFAELYASHVLEHFDYKHEVPEVLREWHRVLTAGGALYVSVPDMERLCHLYLTPRLASAERLKLLEMFFGDHIDDFSYHLAGFDEALLLEQLRQAGYHSFRRVHSFDLFEDSSVMQVFGMPVSLNLIARK